MPASEHIKKLCFNRARVCGFPDEYMELVTVITWLFIDYGTCSYVGERGGLVVEPRIPEREVGGSIPTSAVLCT